jgi:putative sterol carrier protein
MAEKIKEMAEKAIGASGVDLKDVLPDLLDAIKGAEVSDYIKVLKESPDLLMKGMPKVGEYIGAVDPKDALPVIKDALPVILDKVKGYGIEKFVNEVPDLADKFPEMIGGMQEMVKGIGADKLTEYGKEFKDVVVGLFPIINEGLPAVRKVSKDIDDVFNKIKGAKVTAGIDLTEMGWGLKAKFDAGTMTVEEGLEGTDLTLILPTPALFDMFDIMVTGNMSAAMKAFTGGKIKIKGAMMKGAALMPLFSAMGKLGKK